jgi:hypothetical protein
MKRALAFVLALALTVLSFGVQASTFRPPSGFDAKMWDSTLALYGTMGDTTHFLCTTEVIGRADDGAYILLSAGHCVQTIPAGVQFSVSDDIGSPRTDVSMLKAYMKADIDMAIFALKTTKKYQVMELGDSTDLQIGEEVVNLNFALGLGKQLSHGTISSDILQPSGACDDDCSGYFLIQAYGAGGSSGSAVISERTHKLIGLVIWRAPNDNIGLGVEPISKFATFMAEPNQPHPAPPDEDDN